MNARERAEKLVKLACKRQQVQLLDGTVALHKLAWEKNQRGERQFRRYFRFEFTLTGNERREGIIALRGHFQEYLYMDMPDSALFHMDNSTS